MAVLPWVDAGRAVPRPAGRRPGVIPEGRYKVADVVIHAVADGMLEAGSDARRASAAQISARTVFKRNKKTG